MKPSVGLPPVHVSQAFDHDSNQYKCCCKSVHVKSGTHIIAVFSAISLFFSFIGGLGSGSSHILSCLLHLMILMALFHGLKKNDYRCLLPYAIYLVLMCILYSILLICLFFSPLSTIGTYLHENLLPRIELGDVFPELKGDEDLIRSFWICTAVIAVFIYNWFLNVVIKCIKYLSDLQEYEQKEAPIRHVV